MTREQRLTMANAANDRAAALARDAEVAARHRDIYDRVQPLTAAGALWADIARTHATIALALPETESADA